MSFLKLQSLDKWAVAPEEGIVLPGSPLKARTIRLFLNSVTRVRADALWEDNRPQVDPTGQEEYNLIPEVNGKRGELSAFLARFEGYQPIEFSGVVGDVNIIFTDENGGPTEVHFYTPDGESIGIKFEEKTHTRIAAARERNKDLEWAQYMAKQNMRAMLAKMQDSFEERLAIVGGKIVATGKKVADANSSATTGDNSGEPAKAPDGASKPDAAGEKPDKSGDKAK